MHYEYGKGEPVVLLYGLFGSVKNFQPLVQHLKKQYRVIVPVFPIYERGYNITIFSLVTYLEELVEELLLQQFHIVGNSMGGHIALLYTHRHPTKVASLVLSGSSGLFEDGMGDSFPRRKDYAYIKAKTERTFYDPAVATKELIDEIFQTVNSRKALQILSLAKSTIRNNVAQQLPGIQTHCCLIWGLNDNITPPAVAREFKKLMPHARLFWIGRCGHVPMLERPGEFNHILDKFMQGIGGQYATAV